MTQFKLTTSFPHLEVANSEQHETVSVGGGLRVGLRSARPLVTFVLDDGNARDYSVVFPKFAHYGWPATMALVTSWFDSNPHLYTTRKQVDEMVASGWEVASHTVHHYDLSHLAEGELDFELRQSKRDLESLGYSVRNLVYPYDGHNALARTYARKYYRAGGAGYQTPAFQPLQTYAVPRFAIKTGFVERDYVAQVDRAIREWLWIVFVIHSIDNKDYLNAVQESYLDGLMRYIASQHVDVVTLDQGLNLYGNVLDAGDYTGREDYLVVSGSGLVPRTVSRRNSIGSFHSGTPADEFPSRQITVFPVNNDEATGFPAGNTFPGTLIVDRSQDGLSEELSRQFFHAIGVNQLYTRVWNGTNPGWGPWRLVSFSLPRVEKNLQFPQVPGGGEAALSVAVDGAEWGDVAVAQPGGNLEPGLVIKNVVVTAGEVSISLANITRSAVTPSNRTWLIKVLKD